MKRVTIGKKLYLTVLSIFLVFAVAFIVFQQRREKEYKIDTLNMRLQDYNQRMYEAITYTGNSEKTLSQFVKEHNLPSLRVTIIDEQGHVIFDNLRKDYKNFSNHASRKEVHDALLHGSGYDIDRNSRTLKGDFFYSATHFPNNHLIIRSALPYNSDLARSLQADQHYIWFALVAIIILTVVLYRFTKRLGDNIAKLRIFARRAANNESLDTDDLLGFPDDELGEIAERIIKIYRRLEKTRKEQSILKHQLTQNIAHELKTPVASIQGYVETILDNPNIEEKSRELFLKRSYAQCQRLTSLLQDISTLNRMDDARDFMDFNQVDISATVENIERETALQLEQKKMTFENRLPANIRIRGNQSLIYSVFRNLTDNAIAYAGEGTSITVTAKEDTDRWFFCFQDNGIGVPQEHLARLFERFYRVDKGRSRKMGGTGLGLAIVKNAVLLHGGTISVCNRPTGGLQFDFSLKK